MEEWIDIKGFEGIYQISSFGRVKSLSRISKRGRFFKERILKTTLNKFGYPKITLNNQKFYKIHRLVAETFLASAYNQENNQVNHIDGNKENNNKENLEWCTSSHNQKHAYKIGLKFPKKGEKNGRAKLDEGQVHEIRNDFVSTLRLLAKKFNVSCASVSYIKNNKRWKHIK